MRIFEKEIIFLIEQELKSAEEGVVPYDLAKDIYDAIFEILSDIYSEGYDDGVMEEERG